MVPSGWTRPFPTWTSSHLGNPTIFSLRIAFTSSFLVLGGLGCRPLGKRVCKKKKKLIQYGLLELKKKKKVNFVKKNIKKIKNYIFF